MSEERRERILTEVGTNEWEVVVFRLSDHYFAINVDKVREIIRYREPTPMPMSHPAMKGIIEVRGNVIPILDLRAYYGFEGEGKGAHIIISEFSMMKVGFLVDEVDRIYRIRASDLDDTLTNTAFGSPTVLYVIKREGRNVMLLDFERIAVDVAPHLAMRAVRASHVKEREGKRILVAEDSPVIGQMILDSLRSGGYAHAVWVRNGQEALDLLRGGERFDLLITDIEMPVMDGLALTKSVKSDRELSGLPVVVFSSIITEDIARKCKSAGADDYIAKPQIERLAEVLDRALGI